MLLRWFAVVIFLQLTIAIIQANYYPRRSMEKEKSNSTILVKEERRFEFVNRLNKTNSTSLTSSKTKKVCASQSCSDNQMTQETSRHDTFFSTFSRSKLSNDLDVSLENSTSTTFFKHNLKLKKSNGSTDITKNYLQNYLQRIITKTIKKALSKYGINDNSRKSKWTIPRAKQINDKATHYKKDKAFTGKATWKGISDVSLPAINQELRFNSNQDPRNPEQTNKNNINLSEKIKGSTDKNRVKRHARSQPNYSQHPWLAKRIKGKDNQLKMHAFVVRDEEIEPCCQPTVLNSPRRYFMCSGAVLTTKHAITSASCMHFADMYEAHIKRAELAVLVGVFTPTPYVIKITRYEMHPKYIFDIDSPEYSRHNVAILFLSCSFVPNSVIVPKLPNGLYDDVGHVCCGQNCNLITIVQYHNNSHIAKVLKAKHLPSPRHEHPNPNLKPVKRIMMRSSNELRNTSNLIRQARSPEKLAGMPLFFLNDHRAKKSTVESIESIQTQKPKRTKINNIFDEIANARRAAFSNTSSNNKSNSSIEKKKKKLRKTGYQRKRNTSKVRKNPLRKTVPLGLPNGGVDPDLFPPGTSNVFANIANDLFKFDWKQIVETADTEIAQSDKSKVDEFTQQMVALSIQRLHKLLSFGDKIYDKAHEPRTNSGNKETKKLGFVAQHLPPTNGTMLRDIARVFASVVKSILPPHGTQNLTVLSDITIEEHELRPPPPKYAHCPPLGTPIIKNGVLIGLITYTCDDAQDWVKWKYVSISQNLRWIRKRISVKQHQPPVSCGTSGGFIRQVYKPEQQKGYEISPTRERKLREFIPQFNKKYEQMRDEFSSLAVKSPHKYDQVYNPQTVPEHNLRTAPTPEGSEIKSNYNGFTAVSNINANTCFTKPDGSTDCRSITNTYTVL